MKKLLALVILTVTVGAVLLTALPDDAGKRGSSAVASEGNYVALGDSVAAGIGLPNFSDSSACDRTLEAYPNKLANSLHYKLLSVACSGATTQDGLLSSQSVNQLALPAQLSAALKADKPKLISLTIGANDANWTTYIQKCYTQVCGSEADTAAVQQNVNLAMTNLNTALSRIKDAYPSGPPTVIVTGYYRLFPVAKVLNCPELTGIDTAELSWIGWLQDSIDTSLQTAASQQSFVKFVPLSFVGHELCTADPWVQGLSGKAPFHPTSAGQSAIAGQILKSIRK